MAKTLTIRGLEIGSGQPKIIVPIVGQTRAEIIGKAESFADKQFHLVEWRADFYEDIFDTAKTLETLAELRRVLAPYPLMFTFRSEAEGGVKPIDTATYTALNKAVADSGNADIIDVEIIIGDAASRENVENIHQAGAFAIGSSHEFKSTPPQEVMVAKLRKMQELGCDILKVAAMPTCPGDVLALLGATWEMYDKYAEQPLVTMSMAGQGLISRFAGEVFGSAITFGAVGQVSAPGQIPVEELAEILDVVHNSLK